MSKERTLANIAQTAYWDIQSEHKDTFDRVAKAVEKEVLERFKNDEEEPIIAGQELNPYQVLKWIEKYGSKSGLQYMIPNGLWVYSENTLDSVIDTQMRYRVAPKKVNDPNDPTTWEKGVAVFCRDLDYEPWVLDSFVEYAVGAGGFVFRCEDCGWVFAKLATSEQIEAWKLINDENCG